MLIRNCDECGKAFEIDDSRRNCNHVIVCSDACRLARAARNRRQRYVKQKWPQELVCERCQKSFLVHNAGEKSRRKYCTRECYLAVVNDRRIREWESQRQPKICKLCGKAFLPEKFAASRQLYCSDKCFRKGHRTEPKNNEYEFALLRKQVRRNYNDTCQLCGSTVKPHVHHWDISRDGDLMNNDFENLTVLCRNCHVAIHHVSVVKSGNEWKVSGKIFDVLGLSGSIEIY